MKQILIKTTEDEYIRFKEMAAEKNMTVSELVRERVLRESPVDLTIDFADIYGFAEDIHHLVRQISGIIPIIVRSQLVTTADTQFIKERIIKIDNKCIEIFRYITDCRNKLYGDARRKIYKDIRNAGKVRRRSSDAAKMADSGKEAENGCD